jgi:hypothetical protein
MTYKRIIKRQVKLKKLGLIRRHQMKDLLAPLEIIVLLLAYIPIIIGLIVFLIIPLVMPGLRAS